MRIDSSGNVGIGTSSPVRNLQIGTYGTGNNEIAIASATTGLGSILFGDGGTGTDIFRGYLQYKHTNDAMIIGTAATERMRINSSGDLLVGTTDTGLTTGNGIKFKPAGGGAGIATMGLVGNSSSGGQGAYHLYSTSLSQYQFYVLYDGTIAARNTSITSLSDQSEKTNIKDLETGLNQVLALKPRRFDWKNGEGSNVAGFIAQEVESILPDLVKPYKISDTEEKLGLKMGDMIPTMVKAIQELKAELDSVKAELQILKGN
jgi:hypothetical protein